MDNPEELNKKETTQDEAISDEWRQAAKEMEADQQKRSGLLAPEVQKPEQPDSIIQEQNKKIIESFDAKSAETEAQKTPEAKPAEAAAEGKIINIGAAKAELPGVVEKLDGRMGRKERKEAMEQAGELYKTITEKELLKEAKKRGKEQAKKDGFDVISPEEFKKRHIEKEIGMQEQLKKTSIIEGRFNSLSLEERAKYGGDNESAFKNFALGLIAKVSEKRKELSDKGINVSVNSFYAMMENGLRPEDIKARGFWGKLWHDGKDVEIPRPKKEDGTKERSKENFLNDIKGYELNFNGSVMRTAEAIVAKGIENGQRRWKKFERNGAKAILHETVEDIKDEEELKEESLLKYGNTAKFFEGFLSDVSKELKLKEEAEGDVDDPELREMQKTQKELESILNSIEKGKTAPAQKKLENMIDGVKEELSSPEILKEQAKEQKIKLSELKKNKRNYISELNSYLSELSGKQTQPETKLERPVRKKQEKKPENEKSPEKKNENKKPINRRRFTPNRVNPKESIVRKDSVLRNRLNRRLRRR